VAVLRDDVVVGFQAQRAGRAAQEVGLRERERAVGGGQVDEAVEDLATEGDVVVLA
jgi:hypothetical protein